MRRRRLGRVVGLVATAGLMVMTPLSCGRVPGPGEGLPTGSTTPTTTAPVPPAATTTTTAPPAPRSSTTLLQRGASGAEVVDLQRQLAALGYWLGPVDGTFGFLTEQAVTALQKAAGIAPDGVIGPRTAEALAQGVRPVPRSTSGHVVEIDLEHQLLSFVTEGRVDAVLNTSTGSGQTYVSGGRLEVATTPRGRYAVFRQVDGLDVSPLGMLWRPKYFVGGTAVHGYSDVPPYPASHGCVRVSLAAMDWIWATGIMPIGTPVWVY